jgi:hypothetical protein
MQMRRFSKGLAKQLYIEAVNNCVFFKKKYTAVDTKYENAYIHVYLLAYFFMENKCEETWVGPALINGPDKTWAWWHQKMLKWVTSSDKNAEYFNRKVKLVNNYVELCSQ